MHYTGCGCVECCTLVKLSLQGLDSDPLYNRELLDMESLNPLMESQLTQQRHRMTQCSVSAYNVQDI
jgi:hypothetical protein